MLGARQTLAALIVALASPNTIQDIPMLPEPSLPPYVEVPDVTPSAVPIPFPNFSNMSATLPNSVHVNMQVIQAHGISEEGSKQMYIEDRVPEKLPDMIILSSFSGDPQRLFVNLHQESVGRRSSTGPRVFLSPSSLRDYWR
ncbi:hypothetical protein ACYOEI_25015 [Singulisphaera rosea]